MTIIQYVDYRLRHADPGIHEPAINTVRLMTAQHFQVVQGVKPLLRPAYGRLQVYGQLGRPKLPRRRPMPMQAFSILAVTQYLLLLLLVTYSPTIFQCAELAQPNALVHTIKILTDFATKLEMPVTARNTRKQRM